MSKLRMKKVSLLFFIFLLTSSVSSGQVTYSDSISFPHDKAVLLEFTASWCVPCKKMEATTLRDSSVLDFIDSNYFWVVVDVENPIGKVLALKYSANQYPTFLALDASNEENLLRIVGYKPADIFLNDLKFAIADTRFDKP